MRDIRQTIDGDICITAGDIEYRESTIFHQADLVHTRMGELKHSPSTGIGAVDFLQDESPEALMRMTRKQCVRDAMTVRCIEMDEANQLCIDAFYDVDPVQAQWGEAQFIGQFPIILQKGDGSFPAEFPIMLTPGDTNAFPAEFPIQLTKGGGEFPAAFPIILL